MHSATLARALVLVVVAILVGAPLVFGQRAITVPVEKSVFVIGTVIVAALGNRNDLLIVI